MAGINKAIILGRLGRDPEMTYTPSGLAVCKFSIATSKKRKDGQEITQWHRCTAFDKAGELISRYVSKGHMLYVEGEITYSQYEKNGVTLYSTDIIVREFNFVGSGGGPQQGDFNNNQQGNDQQRGGGSYGGQGGGGYQPQGAGGGYQGGGGGYNSPQQPSQGGGAPAGGDRGYQGGAGSSPADPGMTGGQPPEDDIPF